MPRDSLNTAQIVRAATDLLDAEGVDGLSMRRLGTRLGAGATSVYWHVGSRDDLLDLAADAVFGELELPDPERVGWREALAVGADGLRAAVVRHPWLVSVLGLRPSLHGPEIARYQHHSLVACLQAGFTGGDLDRAGSAVFAYVLGATWGEGLPEGAPDEAGLARARETAAAYPELAERFDALVGSDPREVRDDSFRFGLEAVLDGLAARLAEPPDEAPVRVHRAPDGTTVVEVPAGTPVLVRPRS